MNVITAASYFQSYITLENRLESFKKWPADKSLIPNLVNAGFVYSGHDDIVFCPVCKKSFFQWKTTDDPFADHKNDSPDCDFLKKFNTTIHKMCERGLIVKKSVVNMNMARLGRRIDSFQFWPMLMKDLINKLVDAGFFYCGIGDRVQCFYCGIVLHDWNLTDEPWEEHAYIGDKCGYLNAKKDKDFIKYAQEKLKLRREIIEARALELENKNKNDDEDSGNSSDDSPSLENNFAIRCKVCFKNNIETIFFNCCHAASCIDCALDLKDCVICRERLTVTMRIHIDPLNLDRRCKMCDKKEINSVLLDCGHVAYCRDCSESMQQCGVCLKVIEEKSKIYIC